MVKHMILTLVKFLGKISKVRCENTYTNCNKLDHALRQELGRQNASTPRHIALSPHFPHPAPTPPPHSVSQSVSPPSCRSANHPGSAGSQVLRMGARTHETKSQGTTKLCHVCLSPRLDSLHREDTKSPGPRRAKEPNRRWGLSPTTIHLRAS